MRAIPALLLFGALVGCAKPSPPVIKPVIGITARLHKSTELNDLDSDTLIKVPQSDVPAFLKLVTPTPTSFDVYSDDMHYSVADVYLEHKDGTTTKVNVRWTGHNPAAVSTDDRNYFYGGTDVFPDGAIGIVRSLIRFSFEEKQPREAGSLLSEQGKP